jgi:hypothetical protein
LLSFAEVSGRVATRSGLFQPDAVGVEQTAGARRTR